MHSNKVQIRDQKIENDRIPNLTKKEYKHNSNAATINLASKIYYQEKVREEGDI